MSPTLKPEDEIAAAVRRARLRSMEAPRDAVSDAVLRTRNAGNTVVDDAPALAQTAVEQGLMLGWGDEAGNSGRAIGEAIRGAIRGESGRTMADLVNPAAREAAIARHPILRRLPVIGEDAAARYDALQSQSEAEQADLQSRRPWASGAATLTGGLVLGAPAGVRAAIRGAAPAANAGLRLLENGLQGGLLGTIQGAGAAGDGNREAGGLMGFGVGTVAGAAVPELIRGGAAGWDWLRQLNPRGAAPAPAGRGPLAPRSPVTPPGNQSTAVVVRPPMMPDAAPQTALPGVMTGPGEVPAMLRRPGGPPNMPGVGPAGAAADDMDPRVADYLLKQFGRDQTTPGAALDVLRSRQQSGLSSAEGTRITELAGPNMQRGAAAVEARPGEGMTILNESAKRSRDRAVTAMTEDIQRIQGRAAQDTYKLVEDLVTARRADAAPLYEAAYTKGAAPFTAETHPEIMRAKDAIEEAFPEVAQDAAMRASRLMRAEGHGAEPVHTVRWFDYYKRGLDNAIRARQAASDAGQKLVGEEAAILTRQKNAMLRAIDEAVPEYGRARRVFSNETRVIGAIEDARGLLNKTPDEIRAAFRNADSEAEREAIRIAMLRDADNLIRQTAETGDPTKRIARHPFGRDRLMAMMGDDPKKVAALEQALDMQTRTAQTNRGFMGSRTTPLAEATKDLYSGGQAQATETAARQGFWPTMRQAGVRRVETWLSGIDEGRSTLLAQALAAEDEDAAAVLYQLMRRDQQRRAASEAARQATRARAGQSGRAASAVVGPMFGPQR